MNDLGLQAISFDLLERLRYAYHLEIVKRSFDLQPKEEIMRVFPDEVFDTVEREEAPRGRMVAQGNLKWNLICTALLGEADRRVVSGRIVVELRRTGGIRVLRGGT